MLLLKPFDKSHGRSMVLPRGGPTSAAETAFTFISRYEFSTRTLAHVLDSLVRVTRRVNKHHFVSILARSYRIPACANQQVLALLEVPNLADLQGQGGEPSGARRSFLYRPHSSDEGL